MDKGYEKEGFAGFRIKMSVAKRFRRFCKGFGKSQSMTLLAMLDFFELNQVSPDDRLGETVSSLKHQMKRRFNSVIAIIKNMEKQQTKPTKAMLDALFSEVSREQEKEGDDLGFGTMDMMTENEELEAYRQRYQEISQSYHELKMDVAELLENTAHVKGTFGNGHLRLHMDPMAFEGLKQRLQNGHFQKEH